MTYEELLAKLSEEAGAEILDVSLEEGAPPTVELNCQWCGAQLTDTHLGLRHARSRSRICLHRPACRRRHVAAGLAASSVEGVRQAKVVNAVTFAADRASDTADGTGEDEE